MAVCKAEIMKAKGGAGAIGTLTFDDGVSTTSNKLRELMEEYGLVATLMIVPTRIMAEPPYSKGYSDIDELNRLMVGGYIDIESHSYSHLYIAEEGHVDYKPENCNDENRYRETYGSLLWLKEHFPGKHFVAFGVPGGNYDEKSHEYLKKYFYSVRNSWRSDLLQSLTPPDNREHGGWYKLIRMGLSEAKIDNAMDYLDRCVKGEGWFIGACHNIVGIELGKHNYQITVETLSILLKEMARLRDEGKLWPASFGDATRYLREYEASTVKAELSFDKIEVSVNMKSQTPSGLPLDKDIFNFPLTVKVYIPDGYKAENSKDGYVLIDVKPNDKATISICKI